MLEKKDDRYLAFLQKTKNFLIVKDSMGKPKPTTRTLPQEGFTYGRKLRPDAEGVGSLLSSWAEHKASTLPPTDKDFKKLNALSVSEKACTATQQRRFREKSNIRIKTAPQKSQTMVPDMIFGTGARPSTPIKAVLGNFYGEFASDLATANYTPKTQNRIPTATRSTIGFDKRNECIRNSMEDKPKDLFKLKKYQSVKPRTSTRRG